MTLGKRFPASAPDLDQLDGFAAGAFDHQGAGVAEAVGLFEEGHVLALELVGQASRSATLSAMWSCNWPREPTNGRSPWFAYHIIDTSPNSTPARGLRNMPSRFKAGQVRSGPRTALPPSSPAGCRRVARPQRRVQVLLIPFERADRVFLVQVHMVETLGRVVAGIFDERLVRASHIGEAAAAGRLIPLAFTSAICALVEAERIPMLGQVSLLISTEPPSSVVKSGNN